MFEFDRAVGSSDPGFDSRIVLGFGVRLSHQIGREHVEIVLNDYVKFLFVPVGADSCFIDHFETNFERWIDGYCSGYAINASVGFGTSSAISPSPRCSDAGRNRIVPLWTWRSECN